jgi:hypothetical protein
LTILGARRGLIVAAALALAVGSRAGEGNRGADPIRVYFDGGDCGTNSIEVEAFDRQAGSWLPHPTHPRVPVPSCQTEEAGRLWNELRWRCAPWSGDRDAGWRPLRVFDAAVMSHCGVDRRESGDHRTSIRVSSPAEGAVVRAPERFVELRGSVDVDGRTGSDYDLVLLIDRGAPEAAVEAQSSAARAFVRGFASRLGAVRVTVLSFPSSARGDSAQREEAWSADFGAIDAALRRITQRSVVSSRSALPDALDAALGALADARASARAVIVMGVDGARLDSSKNVAPGDPLLREAARVGERGAALHWVALGGLAPEDPALVRQALANAHGSFRRVPPQSYSTQFFDAIALPVAEAVWVEAPAAKKPDVPASLDAQGGFSARVPVASGTNSLVIHARTSDGALHERRFGLVFDDALSQRKELEIRVDPEKKP